MTEEQVNKRLDKPLLRIVDLQSLYYESVKNKNRKTQLRILNRIFNNKRK